MADKIKLEWGTIDVVAACIAFVSARYPEYDIRWIEVGDAVEEEGYFPTLNIIPKDDPFGDDDLEIHLQVWVADGEFIKYQDEMIDLTRCEHGSFVLHNRVLSH